MQRVLLSGLGLLLPVALAGAQDIGPPETVGIADLDRAIESLTHILPPGAVSPADLFFGAAEPWTETSVILVSPEGEFIWFDTAQDIETVLAGIDPADFDDLDGDGLPDSGLSLFHHLGPWAVPRYRFEARHARTETTLHKDWRITLRAREAAVEMNGLWAVGQFVSFSAVNETALMDSPHGNQQPIQGVIGALPAGDSIAAAAGEGVLGASSSAAVQYGDQASISPSMLPEITLFMPVAYSWNRPAAISLFQANAGEGVFDFGVVPLNGLPQPLADGIPADQVNSLCYAQYQQRLKAAQARLNAARSACLRGLGNSIKSSLYTAGSCCVGAAGLAVLVGGGVAVAGEACILAAVGCFGLELVGGASGYFLCLYEAGEQHVNDVAVAAEAKYACCQDHPGDCPYPESAR